MENKVLLVEDCAADAVLVREAFKRADISCKLEHVTDGEQALRHLKREVERPSIVLLDLNLPGLDGHDILKQIRRQDTLRAMPVLVLSTSELSDDIERSYREGANSYIVKPSSLQEMVEVFSIFKEYWFKTASLPSAR